MPNVETATPEKFGLFMPIRESHPFLFKFLMMMAFAWGAYGYQLITKDPHKLGNLTSNPIFEVTSPFILGVIFVLIAAGLLFGISGGYRRFAFARRALIAGTGVLGTMAIGFLIAQFQGSLTGSTAPILWGLWAGMTYAAASEPAINPVAAMLSKGK